MINSDQFTKRLQKIIDFYNESASSFATKVGVQRSSISHILSGRNKPSLDFIMKILDSYPEVELYWLLNGKGVFPKSLVRNKVENTTPTPTPNLFNDSKLSASEIESLPPEQHLTPTLNSDVKKIDRIVIFYNDGTFTHFKN
jgi:transcriptional regulator with XRE-family HTH domain